MGPGTQQLGEASPVSPHPLLTVEALAQFLSISPRGAREVLQRGELPGFRVGRRWYVRPEDLEAAVAGKVAVGHRDRETAVRLLRGLPGAQGPARKARRKP